ncbi:unnamed protein product [Auanema sp. JU1783]|nr:unnamed protein product [Auanema sp. JU1783]
MFFYSVLPPIIFYRAFHKDYDLKLHHLNFTNAQIEFFTKAAFTYLPIFSVKCMIYVVYYGMALGGASLMLFALFRSILSEIRKKQLIISAVTINHHRRMFKTLVIQGGLTLGVFVSTPIALYASIFTHVKSIFVEMSLVVFGLGYFVHSSISLFLYDVKRSRTGIKNLFFSFNSHKEKPKSTISRLHG